MQKIRGKILWADDEIDMLRPHILFLEEKGYRVTPVTNAEDAISLIKQDRYDLLLLDEMMPGMDGLRALLEIKEICPSLPVVMITKSEEENLMDEAIGSKIEDYLTKPVNPSQILSSCKRILEREKISREKLTRKYTAEFGEIEVLLAGSFTPQTWIDIHLRLCERELELDQHPDLGLRQTLMDQRRECNVAFARYIEENYAEWVASSNRPLLSPDVVRGFVLPLLSEGKPVLFIVVDNLRLDQWLCIEPLLYEYFSIERQYYYSILPTATPFSRNSLFAGYFPGEIDQRFPNFWMEGEDEETSKNRLEPILFAQQVEKFFPQKKQEPKYVKIMDPEEGKNVAKNASSFFQSALTAMVFNFVDILAHRRSGSEILKEMIPDEPAYRSLTRTWFEHSALFQILRQAQEAGVRVVLTSDHGSIRTLRGATVIGDRSTSPNVRYKYGRNIRAESKQAIVVSNPKQFGLPTKGIMNYLIAKEDYYFVYPTHYHKYLALYRDSLQHGGVSLEEMVLPVVIMRG